MKTRIWLTAICFAALVACGDDDANDPQTDAGDPDSGAFDNVACNPNGSGACQNADDCPIVVEGTARTAAQTCGRDCLGNADAAACSRTCVVDKTSISSGCADCYVGIVSCSIENCVGACAADSGSQACFDCQVEKNCRSAFDTCSGLPPAKRP
jgi:hypothetical protein